MMSSSVGCSVSMNPSLVASDSGTTIPQLPANFASPALRASCARAAGERDLPGCTETTTATVPPLGQTVRDQQVYRLAR